MCHRLKHWRTDPAGQFARLDPATNDALIPISPEAMAESGRTYSYGTNWTRSGGELHNGRGERIAHPEKYFAAVSSNSRGYNSGYSNGHGEIRRPVRLRAESTR